jgi:alpha-tubulin suppressor-like RCC1 family protein
MRPIVASIVLLLGTLGPRHTTAQPSESTRFVMVTAGADHACALTDKGEAYCWGSNQFGQLGDGPADSSPHPAGRSRH